MPRPSQVVKEVPMLTVSEACVLMGTDPSDQPLRAHHSPWLVYDKETGKEVWIKNAIDVRTRLHPDSDCVATKPEKKKTKKVD